MTLMLRDPFADTLSLRQAMDRLFEQSLPRPDRGWLPVNVSETPTELVIKAALPGVTPEDVDIAIDGDILTISGEFKAEEEQPGTEYHRRELYIGTFERDPAAARALRGREGRARLRARHPRPSPSPRWRRSW